MRNHVHIWVIQTKGPEYIWRNKKTILFSAQRTRVDDRSHLTPIHYRIKTFPTKAEAVSFFYKKVRANVPMQNCKVTRRKLFIKRGQYDYWKNSAHFRSEW